MNKEFFVYPRAAVFEPLEPRLLLTGAIPGQELDLLYPPGPKPDVSPLAAPALGGTSPPTDYALWTSADLANGGYLVDPDAVAALATLTGLSPDQIGPYLSDIIALFQNNLPVTGEPLPTIDMLLAQGEVAPEVIAALGLTMPDDASVSAETAGVLEESDSKTPSAHTILVVPPGGEVGSAGGTGARPASVVFAPGGGAIQSTAVAAWTSGEAGEAPASATTLYATGFEPGEGFSLGFIDFQNNWVHYSGNTTQPSISNAHPQTGTQHLRIAKEPSLGVNAMVGAGTPDLGPLAAGHYTLSVDVAVTATGGADYYVLVYSNSQGLISGGVRFSYLGDLLVADDLVPGDEYFDWVDTGVNWNVGPYTNVTIDLDADSDALEYSYGGSSVYTATVWGGSSMEQAIFRSDNWNLSEVGDFDNLVIQSTGEQRPDLAVGRPGNWTRFIPVGTTPLSGTDEHSYEGAYYDDQVVYFNWGSLNIGTGEASGYTVTVEVTGPGGGSWQWTGLTTAAGVLDRLAADQAVGPLSAGTHTFKLWLDSGDALEEPSEVNNYHERTVTVLPAGAPAAQDVTAGPLGVSDGVTWFRVDGEITDFGGEHVYAADLTAGQRLSASVQTPEYGGSGYSNSTAVPVPDDGTVVTSEITITGSRTIDDLDVRVAIEHLDAGDLDIVLVAPDGITTIDLSTGNGGGGNHYWYTNFDDEAPIAIDDLTAQAPFYGRHRPESPLSVLDGTDAAGTWQLRVTDTNAAGAPDGTLLYWDLSLNQALDVSLTITGPDGELAYNGAALGIVRDAAVADVAVPTTGTYYFRIGNQNGNVGAYSLEAGIVDDSVAGETGATTDLDLVRPASRNAVAAGMGDGIGAEDVYTITLNAGEAVTVGATTPGGFYGPSLQIDGPGGFQAADVGSGPAFDSAVLFTAPATGTYTITVGYAFDQEYTNVVSMGSYVLSVILSDDAVNDALTTARPISVFAYHEPFETQSVYFALDGLQGVWRGTIDPAGEHDYFHIGQLSSGELIRITVQREGESQLFPMILLANSAAQVVTWGLPYRYEPLTGVAFIETIISEADDYYLVVVGDMTEPGGSTPSGGEYLLFYSGFGMLEDAYEDNDSQAQADAAPPGGENSPNLGPVGEVTVIADLAMMEDSEDWFRFETSAGGGRGDYVRIVFAHAQGNLNLDLLDAGGGLIRRSQTVSDNERVSLQGLPAGTYYARIWGLSGGRNPDYSLRIQTGSPGHRLTSPPFTTDEQYTLEYELDGAPYSSVETLVEGLNELVVTTPSGGDEPFVLLFDVTRVGSMTDQTGYQYDLLGNLSRTTDAMDRTTVYQYDPLGRLVYVDGPDYGDASLYAYDGNDNLVQMVDATAGATEYTYDELDRLTQIVLPNGLGTIQYEYDPAGRIAAMTYPDTTIVNYTYDDAGRLETATEGDDVTTYAYNAAGQIETVTLAHAAATTYAASYLYDEYGRLTDIAYTDAAGWLVTSFHYTLDDNGNRTAMEARRQNTGTPEDDYVSGVYGYEYDPLNRLAQASYPDGTVVDYTYDANGNRLSMTTDPDGAGPDPATVENYEYGYDNRLGRVADAGAATLRDYHYDPRGNVVMVVTATDTVRYEYDYRNLLTSVEDGANRIEYLYDGNGDRVAEVVNGVRTNYVNDPNQAFTQVLAEADTAGATQARYTYGLGRISGLLPGEATEVYYVADALGSTADLVDAAGAALQSYSYDAFGALRETLPAGAAGSLANDFLFTGENLDANTGLVYLRARYYDPSTGRFMSKDPFGFVDGTNLYGYCLADPVNMNDPSGQTWLTDLIMGGPIGMIAGAATRFAVRHPRVVGRGLADVGWNLFSDTLGKRNPVWSVLTGVFDTSTGAEWFVNRIPFMGTAKSLWGFGRECYTTWMSDRGGVLLNKAVDFVGDLENITGATVDPVTGQVVLLGEGDSGGAVPDLRLDDFVTAVLGIFGSAEDPGVTIDPPEGHEQDPSYPQLVHLFGGLEDTDMGYVVFEADRVMKCLGAREDNITGNPVGSSVPGYYSMLDRWFDRAMATHGSSYGSQSRFWFVPTDVKLVRSADGESFVFDKAAVQLLTEDMFVGNGAVDPDAQAFSDWFNANFDALAAEAYAYPSTPGYEYSFRRLEQCARAIAFARFLYDNNIPVDFSWIEDYEVPFVDTPDTTTTVQNSRTGTYEEPPYIVTITITIVGGVTMETPNIYLSGAEGLQGVVLGARDSELTQQWTVNVDGQDQTAVALQLDTEFVDGLDFRADADLAYQTPGDIPFGLTRYYSSTDTTQSALGYGWQLVPYGMEFARPEFYNSSRSPYTFLNGLHEGEVRIVDRPAGRTLTFLSSFQTQRFGDGGFGYGGVDETGTYTVPEEFIPGGSEMPDGSTLQQDSETRDYILTRPDGSQMIFDYRGRLMEMIDSRGRAISYGYTGDQVTSIQDSAGQTIALTYDGSGRVVQAAGVGGEVVNYVYYPEPAVPTDPDTGDLKKATRARDGDQIEYLYEYDAEHHVAKATLPDQVVDSTSMSDIFGRTAVRGDARGNEFASDFDPATRTTTTTDAADGSTTVEQTDSLGRPISVIDQLGRETRFYYDVERVYDPMFEPHGWTYVHYTNGTNRQPSLIQMPDPSRPWMYLEYDDNGNVTRLEDRARGGDVNGDGIDDHPQLFEYDAGNNLVRYTDARGYVTEYTYEVLNEGTPEEQVTDRQTSMTRGVGTPSAATWTWQYDPVTGLLVREAEASGVVTEYEYDPLGNLTRQTVAALTADETPTTYTYDAFSRRTTETDGELRTTRYAYDGRDQLTATTLGGTTDLTATSEYDETTGRRVRDTDFEHNATEYEYDAATGDLVVLREGAGTAEQAETAFEYDRFGNIERVVDPVGNVTTFEYDELQRLVHKTSLGHTPRVVSAAGSNADAVVGFSDPIDGSLIDDGVEVFVTDSQALPVPGSSVLSGDGLTLTWTADAAPLGPDTYTLTLRAEEPGELTTLDGRLLDGEFFGLLPSGDDEAGGDFVFDWFVDDHGNDAAHATQALLPGSVGGEIEFRGDADWFAFEAIAGNRLRFEVVLDSLHDSVLHLYDLDGETVLAENDDIDTGSSQFGSRIDWEAPRTGTYYLRVRAFAHAYTGTYQLDATVLADDHADEAQGATEVDVPSVTGGQLEVPTDTDVFSFEAGLGQEYRITTILDTLEDSTLTIYDTDGTTPLESNDTFFTGDKAAYLFWTAPADGTYTVAVRSHNGEYRGTYELALSIDDHGDYAGDATGVAVGSQTPGDLEVRGDRDWFSFDAAAGSLYGLGVELGTLADSRLFVVDTDAATILAWNDDFQGPGSQVFWPAPEAGTYYLRVDGHDGAGTYTLGVAELADDHGNDADEATPVLVVPSSTPGDVETPGDVDWFSFEAADGVLYRLQTALHGLDDSVIRLYDADGVTLLAENDDYAGLRSRINWRAPDDGPGETTYYVEVLAAGELMTGTYDMEIIELEEDPPQGSLVFPVPGSLVTVDPGYVEIEWTDDQSGINEDTIGPSDVTVTGVTVGQVERHGNAWRYSYEGQLPDGTIEVKLLALHVADLADNWNEETTATFTFDVAPPSAGLEAVAPDPRLTAVEDVTIVFSEEVGGFDVGDLTLTRDGGGDLLTGSELLSTDDNITYVLGDLAGLTAAEGTYALTLTSAGSSIVDLVGRALEGDASDTWVKYDAAEIHGLVYHDVNENGQRDGGEEPVPDWVVYLDLNNDRQLDAGEPSTLTGQDGQYAFTDLFPGSYTVAQQRRAGWIQTTPDPMVRPEGQAAPLPAATDVLPAITTTGSAAPVFPMGQAVDAADDAMWPLSHQSGSLINLDEFQGDWRFEDVRGAGYAAVVLDTGIDLDHPFFGPDGNSDGIADRIVYQYDFADGDGDASDVDGHGSNVTSIIASQDSLYGGMAPAVDIIHLKVFTDAGGGTFGITEQALQWVVANAGAYNVISVNMSLGDDGNYGSPRTLYGIHDELSQLASLGVIAVSSAGNDFYEKGSVQGVGYPAADPNCLAISAVWDANYGGPKMWSGGAIDYTTGPDRVTSFSQRHQTLTDVFAPGAMITGASHNGGTVSMAGTSQASPHISGIAVLAQELAERELGRRLTPSEFAGLLRSTAVIIHDGDDEDDNVINTALDFPRVDVLAMGEAILSMSGPGPGTYAVELVSGQVVADRDFGNKHLVSDPPGAPDLLATSDTGRDGDDDVTQRDNSTTAKRMQFFVDNTIGGATVTIYADGTLIGSAVAGGTSTVVTTDGTTDVPDGAASITARQAEPDELESLDSPALGVTIDTQLPTASVPDLDTDSDTGQYTDDDVTQGVDPLFGGTSSDAASGVWKVEVQSDDSQSATDDSSPFYSAVLPTLSEGTRTVTATVYDVAGNSYTTGGLSVTVDRTAPRVDAFGLSSTDASWALGTVDSSVWTQGRIARTASWSVIDRFVLDFDEAVFADPDDLSLTGQTAGPVSLTGPAGAGSARLSWDAPDFLTSDRYQLLLASGAGVQDLAGNALDGDGSMDVFPSGDGAAGGDWGFDLNVLVGDVNGDGGVSGRDRRDLRDAYGSALGDPDYNILADLNGDGGVTGRDRRILRDHYGDALSALPEADALLGDANGDGVVDGADYTAWADHYMQPGGPQDGDFNGDGLVDGADFTAWADNYGGQ